MQKIPSITRSILAAALIGLLPAASLTAGETVYRFDPINQTSRAMEPKNLWAGYQVFQNSCKNCHHRGNDKGAVFLHEESRTSRGWSNVFYQKSVQCARTGVWDKLGREDMLVLHDYLHSKAYDMWNPNTAKSCG